MSASVRIHPAVDGGVRAGKPDFPGGTLVCHCMSNPVEVQIASNCLHNHVCGCTKCWKPAGAVFSMVSVVPSDAVKVTRNVGQTLEEPLQIHGLGDRAARRAQIVNLFARLQPQLGLAIVIVAHDLAIPREVCSAVTVMYLGRVAEEGAAKPFFADPAHPCSQALLSAVPSPDLRIEATRPRILLAGDPPSPRNPLPGCRFSTRCPVVEPRCREAEPALRAVQHGGAAACQLADARAHAMI